MSERACIYIAARLSEAQRVEEVLQRSSIDYAVEIVPYATRLLGLFPRQYQGAMFSVCTEQAQFSRHALHAAGLTKGLVEEE